MHQWIIKMTNTDNIVLNILKNKYPEELATSIVQSYTATLKEYKKRNWKYAGNEIGQFIEVARRLLEFVFSSQYTPLSERLPFFNESSLHAYEQANQSIGESYRILIPRYLYAMYSIRNKRGIIHKSEIDPNAMDLTILLNSAKWVLSEMIRLSSDLSFEQTSELIESLMEKEQPLFWDVENTVRLLDVKMDSASKILCLLYYKDRQTDIELQNAIEYQNSTNFKAVLKKLHKERKIEYTNGICLLSPIGIIKAEAILSQQD